MRRKRGGGGGEEEEVRRVKGYVITLRPQEGPSVPVAMRIYGHISNKLEDWWIVSFT